MSEPMTVLAGHGVSDGIAIGPVLCVETRAVEVFRFPIDQDDIAAEIERLREAVRGAQAELARTQERIERELGSQIAGIFDAQQLLLGDRAFIERVVDAIRSEQVNAEWALQRVSDELSARFARIDDAALSLRGEDLRDITAHLQRALQGLRHHELSELEGPIILVADELTPSEALRLGRDPRVAGFAIEGGGETSHTTIVARALNKPLVTGLAGVTRLVTDATLAVLDGNTGQLILHPHAGVLAERREAMRRHDLREDEQLRRGSQLAQVTRDGTEVSLQANVELVDELADASAGGARGIGLYRSEFLYIEKSPALPTEQEQLEVIGRMLRAMAPHPVVVRTFDLGGRKLAREVMHVDEENPNLGLRGIRLTEARPEIFRVQVRALLRAAQLGELWVMIPMVSTVDEIRRFKATCESVRSELEREGVAHNPRFPIGTMIEVPAAALIADHIVREVDFLAIGTNDLIQYSLAVDRSNEHVASLYQPLHPGVLRLIHHVVAAAGSAGKPVSLCGEMGGDPDLTAVLLGLGLRRLSMAPRAMPPVLERLRELDVATARAAALRCLEMATADEVRDYLRSVDLLEPRPAGEGTPAA